MSKHVEDASATRPGTGGRVLDQEHGGTTDGRLPSYDVSSLVGLRVVVENAAIQRTDADGEVSVEIPKLRELMASAAVARCLMPIRLRGREMKAMRKIMKLTMAELARKLDERTATETVSRWESEAQLMGGYVEKLLRLHVCEALKASAPGIDYDASKIAHLRVQDPWRANDKYEVPQLVFSLVRFKGSSGTVDAWEDVKQAA